MPQSQDVVSVFDAQAEIYRKIIAHNILNHEEVYACLRQRLQRMPPFRFLDIACWNGECSARMLAGTRVSAYHGVDVVASAIAEAQGHLSRTLDCPIVLRVADYVDALALWDEPVDVVWIGMSLHHLPAVSKAALMRRVCAMLPRDGLFLIWEPTLLEDEDRQGWLARFSAIRNVWAALSDEEFAAFRTHMETSDFPESAADWLRMGRDAGFDGCEELYVMRNRLGRVYRYRRA